MIKKIHFIFLLIMPFLALAQTNQLSVSSSLIRLVIDPVSSSTDAYTTVTNTTSQPLNVVWTREIVSGSTAWQYQVCDKNSCWENSVISKTFNLAVGETARIDVKLLHGGVVQNGVTNLKLNVVGADANQALNTRIEWLKTAVKTSDYINAADLKLFPNPTTDYFQLNKYDGVNKVIMFNLMGKQVKSFDIADGKSFYVADFTSGMYLVRVLDKNDKIIKTVRLNKR